MFRDRNVTKCTNARAAGLLPFGSRRDTFGCKLENEFFERCNEIANVAGHSSITQCLYPVAITRVMNGLPDER